MILKTINKYIEAKIYDIPIPNNIPIGPSQIPSIATSLESPLPKASFLKTSLEKYLNNSKAKNAPIEPNIPFKKTLF